MSYRGSQKPDRDCELMRNLQSSRADSKSPSSPRITAAKACWRAYTKGYFPSSGDASNPKPCSVETRHWRMTRDDCSRKHWRAGWSRVLIRTVIGYQLALYRTSADSI